MKRLVVLFFIGMSLGILGVSVFRVSDAYAGWDFNPCQYVSWLCPSPTPSPSPTPTATPTPTPTATPQESPTPSPTLPGCEVECEPTATPSATPSPTPTPVKELTPAGAPICQGDAADYAPTVLNYQRFNGGNSLKVWVSTTDTNHKRLYFGLTGTSNLLWHEDFNGEYV
mgnify:FL=1